MRESVIERYLHKRVTEAGGTTRKFTGRIHAPDRIVIWPGTSRAGHHVHFVECKAPLKKARPGQKREHTRLRALDCYVLVLDTKEMIDLYVESWK